MRDIAIISPHLDDAVLSMADHILRWKELGKNVDIITVFSSFNTPILSSQAQHFLRKAGTQDVRTYEHLRKREDLLACSQVCDVQHNTHLDFVDAAFRTSHSQVLYPTRAMLFSGQCKDNDAFIKSLIKSMRTIIKSYQQIYIPAGIGNHIDHILVRDAVLKTAHPTRYGMYIEYPYALSWKNWSLWDIVTYITHTKSVSAPTLQKRKALSYYKSQLPLLFPTAVPTYSEVIYQPVGSPL